MHGLARKGNALRRTSNVQMQLADAVTQWAREQQ